MELSFEQILEKSMLFLTGTIGFEKEEAQNLLKEYFVFLDKELQVLDTAIVAREFPVILSSAHAVKGSAGNSNLEELAQRALNLEQSARMENSEDCNQAFYDLKQCVEGLKLAYQKI